MHQKAAHLTEAADERLITAFEPTAINDQGERYSIKTAEMRAFCCMLILLFCDDLLSQRDSVFAKTLRLGFNIGLNYSELGFNEVSNSVNQISPYSGPGFRMGLLADYRIDTRYSFLPKAEVSFNETGINIQPYGYPAQIKHVYPVTLEAAAHCAIKVTDRLSRPFLVLGPSLKTPLKLKSADDVIMTRTSTVAMDLGFCFDKKLKHFFLSPELRYSLGLNRITNIEGVKNARFHSVSLLLNFKGGIIRVFKSGGERI